MYCDCCPTRRIDSFRPYLNQTLCSLGRYQNLELLYPCFSIGTYLQGVSASDLVTLFFVLYELSIALFLKKRFKCDIIGKYCITLARTFFLVGSTSTSPGLFCLILPFCVADRTSIQFLIFIAAIENTTIRTCVYFLYFQSKRANNLFLLHMLQGSVYSSLEACSLQYLVAPQIPYQ